MMTRTSSRPGPRPAAVPGEAMLRPVALVALAVLVVNDHLLKARWGTEPWLGTATGKISDVAGLIFFPLLLVSLVEVTRWARRRRARGDPSWAFSGRELTTAVVVTGLGFAAVQVLPVAADLYSDGLAALRWLPSGLSATVTGASPPPLPSMNHIMDPTDVLCLPALGVSLRVGRRILGSRAGFAATIPPCRSGATRSGGIVVEGSGA